MQPLDPNAIDPTGELAERIAAQEREYGTYVAASRIYAGNALAYDVGHPVPVSNVVAHGYWHNGQVALVEGADHAPEIADTINTAVDYPADGSVSPPITGDGSETAIPPVDDDAADARTADER